MNGTIAAVRATVDDLARFEGKAELIAGRLVPLMATGRRPNRIAGEIFVALRQYARTNHRGEAYTGNMGFVVPELLSGRESFSPDASYYDGPFTARPMTFIAGPPTFAAEVRSENDSGPTAELEMAAKRADYFEAGTLVVWDVDPVAERVTKYRHDAPARGQVFARGQIADAEPALPGWRLAVDAMFE